MHRQPAGPPPRRLPYRALPWGAAGLFALALAGGAFIGIDMLLAAPKGTQATYVGRQSCAQCHQQQEHLWTGSPHDRALELATPETVLGNFNDQELTYQGVTSKMFRRDGKYFVRTDGRDGKLADFEVKYVIGYDPLQQYMVEFPDGRVQVLRISWDVLGGRWFYQYPPDVKNERLKPDDPLHWTGPAMNWNHMCAECHSTDLKKGFDVATNRYHTTYSEIDVSCETCHGPGSLHVDAAKRPWPKWDRNHGLGLPKLKGGDSKNEIEACAQCHSRRHAVHPDWRPGTELLDYYAPATLDERLYYADGQIRDEVYEYGSFLQSKMHAKGIRCTDCHDPHSTRLRHSDNGLRGGNALCTSCHQHPAGKYDVPAHHHHKPDSSGAQCVNCHMPTTHYMVVDPRRDHSFRVPRPDVSVKLGTPNACTGCHLEMERSAAGDKLARSASKGGSVAATQGTGQTLPQPLPDREGSKKPPSPALRGSVPGQQPDYPLYYADYLELARGGDKRAAQDIKRLNDWSAGWVEKWYGPKKDAHPHFAFAFDAAWQNKPEAGTLLLDLLKRGTDPPIVRATAISLLGNFNDEAIAAAEKALKDRDSLVRAAAVGAVASLPSDPSRPHPRSAELAPMLADPVRMVRNEAARVLAPQLALPADKSGLNAEQRLACERALNEYRRGQNAEIDQASAHTNLGQLNEVLGDDAQAAAAYETAMRLDPRFFPAQFRLAMVRTRQGQKDQTEQLLRGIIERAEKMTDPQYLLAPVLAEAHFLLGLLLNERPAAVAEAERELLAAEKAMPNLFSTIHALATFYTQHKQWDKAEKYARRLAELEPRSNVPTQLLQQIESERRGVSTSP